MKGQHFFTAAIIPGSGIARTLGTPTLNCDLEDVPQELEHGVYAVRVKMENNDFSGVMHFGERQMHGLPISCEVHIFDHAALPSEVDSISVNVVGRLREVENFESEEELQLQIIEDITQATALLQS